MLKEKLIESGKVFIIGIAGDSGSGKTTFANGIKRMFGEDIVSHITLDDYHVYDREMRERLGITPLHPSANNLKLVETHLYMLKKGERIKKPTYDHKTGTFGEWEDFEPTPIVIVEGLHTLYDGIRNYIDFKIFVDPARYIKRLWKIRRDVKERGYDRDKVIREIIRREPDYKRYIDFQKIYADVVIKILPSSIQSTERIKYLVDSREEVYKVRLILKKTDIPLESVSLNIDISDLVKASERDFSIGFFSDYYYAEKASFIDIDGFLNIEIFKSLFDSLKKEIGDGEIKIESEYVNAIEFSKLLVCWKLVEVLKHSLS
ncbi:phosphoribulokinase [Archaeoglobus sp.]